MNITYVKYPGKMLLVLHLPKSNEMIFINNKELTPGGTSATLIVGVAMEKSSMDRLIAMPNRMPHSSPHRRQVTKVTVRGSRSAFLLLHRGPKIL